MSDYIRFYNNDYNFIFITVVTYNRKPILIDNIELLRESFKYAKKKYTFEIYAISVLKDHFHVILKFDKNSRVGKTECAHQTKYNYSEIIRLIKYYFSIHYKHNVIDNNSKIKKREKCVWQRRFWEHTIRNEKDLNVHLDYIHYNSVKHYNINPQDWIYSSFNKFVNNKLYEKDWCNAKNANNILNLDFE